MDREYKEVDKGEFDKFIDDYPSPLNWDVARICEPPMGNYNDFSAGKKWPESMVAKVVLWETYKKPNKHYILVGRQEGK